MQFDADGLPIDGPARATPRSSNAGSTAQRQRGGTAAASGGGGGSADAIAAGGDLEAENAVLRSRLQAVESVSGAHAFGMGCNRAAVLLGALALRNPARCFCLSCGRQVVDARSAACFPSPAQQAAADALGELEDYKDQLSAALSAKSLAEKEVQVCLLS